MSRRSDGDLSADHLADQFTGLLIVGLHAR
jgi:hypothetical protein